MEKREKGEPHGTHWDGLPYTISKPLGTSLPFLWGAAKGRDSALEAQGPCHPSLSYPVS